MKKSFSRWLRVCKHELQANITLATSLVSLILNIAIQIQSDLNTRLKVYAWRRKLAAQVAKSRIVNHSGS